MTRYRHCQVGTLVLALGGLTLALLGALLVGVDPHPVGIAVLGLLILCFGLFSTLTVEVTDTHIHLRFGPGVIRKTFALESIRDARAVRNRWYFGWGIRVLPRGWLYNVSGLDAIEIEMRDGRVHRIGTDEPAELLKAVREACGAATRPPGV
jgi:hypothetical protein